MKKTIFKGMAVLMVGAMLLPMAACGGGEDDQYKGRKEIAVSYYIGEFGDEWLKTLATEWNDSQTEYYVKPYTNMNLSNINCTDIRSGSKYDIFIGEDCNYQALYKGNYLEDLTSFLSVKPDGESGKTVGGKISNYDSWMNVAKSSDEKVYVLPYNLAPCGLIFDYERFQANGWLMTDGSGNVTVGKDGVAGTYDDGQPATMAEFKTMCNRIMSSVGDNVFMYMGAVAPDYLNNIFYAYMAQMMGEETYNLFMDKDTHGQEAQMDDGSSQAFGISEGHKAFQMKGVKESMQFMVDYFGNSNYVNTATMTDRSITVDNCHTKFIMEGNTQPAFLVEGNWFENGSRSLFASLGIEYGSKDYRYMMLPSAEGTRSHVFSQTGGGIIVTKQDDANKCAAIKDFLAYMLKDDNLARTTAMSGMMWNYDYNLGAQRSQMTKFAQNTYDMMHDTQNVSVRSVFLETTATPIYCYSRMGVGNLIYGLNGDPVIFNRLRENSFNVEKYYQEVKTYNDAVWAESLSLAKSYGFYLD